MYCHNDTVKQLNTYYYDQNDPAYAVVMSDVPITNHAKHVSGVNDVAFERDIPVPSIEDAWTGVSWKNQRLSNATYDPATKTCSNTACHQVRANVKWGTPYKARDSQNDCDRCHDQGGNCPDYAEALTRQPSIKSNPSTLLAAPGYLYSYSVVASEPGGGAIAYTLPVAPEGMSISSNGVVTWTPGVNQLGAAPVKIVVSSDASGGTLIAIQEFTITAQLPQPKFTSVPITTATSWKAYSYKAVAPVPGGMPAATFALTTPPTGMTINATTGQISWTPTDQQVGTFPITITATSAGYSTTQSYDLQVNPSPLVITSTPVTTGATQVAYSYTVTASMPGATTYSYSLLTRPTGMTINASTGVISWTPSSTQAGNFTVTVQANSGGTSGYYARQSFIITVTASAITITSTPVTTAKVGVAYSYPVIATMPGGGPFTYSLTVRPTTAMTISTAGIVSWTPTATYVGTRAVTVRVAKGSSSATQSYNIVVSP
jgi:predicted CxxxxCH...CXXCH cytochrome family protein